MSTASNLILITGGNSGVGLELAAQLLASSSTPKHILLGCRSIEKGEKAVEELSSRGLPGTVELVHIDVADEKSIEEAAKVVEEKYGKLDALVNNAAVASFPTPSASLATRMMIAFQTNALGALLTVEAFLPLLRASSTGVPRIINVSSGAGSVTKVGAPGVPNFGMDGMPYCASKAAMNMISVSQQRDYGPEGVKVFTYTPGFVVSNLGPHNNLDNGARPTADGARPIVDILDGARDHEAGLFLRGDGVYPW